MGFEEIRLVIERHLAGWDGVPVAYDGVRNSPAVDAAIKGKMSWVRCSILSGESRTAGISDRPCVRRVGIISFQIFTPENTGSAPAFRIADSLARHFEYYQYQMLETQASSAQRVGPENGWYQLNLNTPFRAG